LIGYHHAQWLSRRLIATLITVPLVPSAASRVIGKTVQRAQDDRFHHVLGAWSQLSREILWKLADRPLDAGHGVRPPSHPAVVQYRAISTGE
jgi:hypothetical protein